MTGRLLVVGVGLLLAIAAAVVTFLIGLAAIALRYPDDVVAIASTLKGRVIAAAFDGQALADLLRTFEAAWSTVLRVSTVPVVLIALGTEAAGGAGFVVLMGGTAGLTVLMPAILSPHHDTWPGPTAAALLLLVGAVAGGSYWLLAGRAGLARGRSTPDQPSPFQSARHLLLRK